MKTFTFSTQNTRFAGVTWEPPQFDKVMILVHGIGEYTARYAPVAEYFSQHGFLVTGIDHYGHGNSEGKKGASKGMNFVFDYLQAFLDKVIQKYNKPVVLYGHSMGGGVTTGFILHRQPRIAAAVISAPMLLLPSDPSTFLKRMAGIAASIFPNIIIRQPLDINKISRDPVEVEKFKNDPLRHDKMTLLLGASMLQNGDWCLQHADRLQVPTLLMHGNADEFTNVKGSRLFAARAPRQLLTYKEWNGLYHEIHNELNKKDVWQFTLNWLQTVP
ncbi:alpha/beta hydrolase [Chitinophaga defluvii]|uniref:Lysophospholipase n=1 Tax=Chitinophaga defluvii TaxID=3163343 RepID=A0ABV2T3X0_9BACT